MVNKVILVGNLGQDSDLRFSNAGVAVCNFSMATSERWTNKDGEKQERTEWHRVALWGKLADSLSQYLKKGTKVYVEGSLQTKSWEDQASGVKKQRTEIKANLVRLISGGGGFSEDREKGPHDNTPKVEDVPF